MKRGRKRKLREESDEEHVSGRESQKLVMNSFSSPGKGLFDHLNYSVLFFFVLVQSLALDIFLVMCVYLLTNLDLNQKVQEVMLLELHQLQCDKKPILVLHLALHLESTEELLYFSRAKQHQFSESQILPKINLICELHHLISIFLNFLLFSTVDGCLVTETEMLFQKK